MIYEDRCGKRPSNLYSSKNESVHQYEERIARFIELERVANLKSLADKDKEIREIKSAYRTDEQRDRVIYKQQRSCSQVILCQFDLQQ